MTTYTYNEVLVWSSAGGYVRNAANQPSVSVTDVATGLDVTVIQNGVTQVGFLVGDPSGRVTFTATVPSLNVDFGAGKVTLYSAEAITSGLAAAAAAADSATAASSSASAAATSALAAAASNNAGSGLRIYQNSDGTWPARSTITSSRTQVVTFVMQYDVTREPTIGVDGSAAYATDLTATPKIPGDQIEVRLPL
jgi:hypothetical protein